MAEIQKILDNWELCLSQQISVGGLISRNKTAYKWKAMYRVWAIRESALWRTHDLLSQAQLLYAQQHILGSRILLRSALETIAILIYLNIAIEQVLLTQLDFLEFSKKTSRLLLGSRNKTTSQSSINIITILEKSEHHYNGILKVYTDLCECAHPNHEGLCFGYSRVNFQEFETNFSNHWYEMWGDKHNSISLLILTIFEEEYNVVSVRQINKLEEWLSAHDTELEENKELSSN